MKTTKEQKDRAINMLKNVWVKEGTKVYSVYMKRTNAGMWLRVFVLGSSGPGIPMYPVDITGYVASACDLRYKDMTFGNGALLLRGTGFSHAQAVCEALSCILGFELDYEVF